MIELLIVILIIGILAAIGLGAYNGQRNKAKNADAKTVLRQAHMAVRSYYAANETYNGLQSASSLAGEELTLVYGNGPGDPMWPTSGNPDTYQPGGAQVDPRRIRLYVYAEGAGQCVIIGNLSRGNMAYTILDCHGPMTRVLGGVPRNVEPGVYYGASPQHLSAATSEAIIEKPSAYDED